LYSYDAHFVVYIPYYLQQQISSNAVEVTEGWLAEEPSQYTKNATGDCRHGFIVCCRNNSELDGIHQRSSSPSICSFSGAQLVLFYNVSDEKVVLFLKEKILAKLRFFAYWHRGSRVSPPDVEEQENN
jgi:hypothetical protein